MISWALKSKRTALMILALLLIAGWSTYLTIPKESAPDVPIPVMYVSMSYQGISPEDSVNLLIKPMEQELRSLEGLDEMESTAYEGGGNVVLNFQAGFDNDQALLDVREKVDLAKSELPQAEEADDPRVREVNVSLFPILSIILSGPVPEREMKLLAEDLKDELEGIKGVLEVRVVGTREEILSVEVDAVKLQHYGISPATVLNLIQANNRLVAAGSLETESGQYAVKVPGLFRTRDELMNMPILTDGENIVRIKDVANVTLGFKDAETRSHINGEPAVILRVKKRIGENLIDTVDEVKAKVEELRPTWPNTLEVNFTADESEQTRSQVKDLENNVATAIFLVMVVILAALGWRSAGLVALTVPGSFLSAVLILGMLGITMNVVVLFGLILAVGMLVDGGIVVTEQADQFRQQGQRRTEAFGNAAKVMAAPIISSTATTLAVFLPLLFWPDTVGQFMKYLPITMLLTLGASLFMALVFLPVLGSILPGGNLQSQEEGKYAHIYGNILAWAIERPLKIFYGVLIAFVLVIVAYGQLGKGVEFFPRIEPSRSNVVVKARGDYSLEVKDAMMQQVAERLQGLQGVSVMQVATGVSAGNDDGPSDVIGTIFLEYQDWSVRGKHGLDSRAILADVVNRTSDLAGMTIEAQEQKEGPGGAKPIAIQVTAPTFEQIPPVIAELTKQLSEVDGVINIDDNLPEPGIEWQLKINRVKAIQEGTSLTEIGTNVRLITSGAIIGTYRPADRKEEMDIVARFKPEQRDLSALERITVHTPNGQVPLSHFVERQAQPKVTVIRRSDQRTAAKVEADVTGDTLAADVVAGIRAKIAETELPRGIKIEFKGDDEDQRKAGAFLMKAFGAALFIMAIILVAQFNSFYQAMLILSAVVLSTAGVLLGHIILGKPFGIVMSGIGVISLAGIVVNNNIVLIDQYNIFRKTMHWREAVIETGKSRLRPVFLTAMTTVIGLLPLAARVNIDLIHREITYNAPSSQWWDSLAASIIFGLTFATVLTLIVTPCLLAWAARRSELKEKKHG